MSTDIKICWIIIYRFGKQRRFHTSEKVYKPLPKIPKKERKEGKKDFMSVHRPWTLVQHFPHFSPKSRNFSKT